MCMPLCVWCTYAYDEGPFWCQLHRAVRKVSGYGKMKPTQTCTQQYTMIHLLLGERWCILHIDMKRVARVHAFRHAPILRDDEVALIIKFKRLSIIPRGGLSKHSSGATTPDSTRLSKKPRVDSSENPDANPVMTQNRSASFRETILQRDQHCVITRKYIDRSWSVTYCGPFLVG